MIAERHDMQDNNLHQHSRVSEIVLGCCFDVMNELGSGFLESVYKNALFIALKEKGLEVEVEKRFDVMFRERKIGLYIADVIVEGEVIVELKCVDNLHSEHQAQLINYLKISGVKVGLLVNFGRRKLEVKRLSHPDAYRSLESHVS